MRRWEDPVSSSHRTDPDTIQQRLRSYLDERMNDLTRGLSELMVRTPAPPDQGSVVRFMRHAERSTEQLAILERLVEEAAGTGSRTILFVVKGGALRGWAARGMPGPFQVKSVSLPVTPDDLIGRAVESATPVVESPGERPGNAALATALGSDMPTSMLAAPLWVKDRVVALLYVDTVADGPWQPESALLMASVAALSLEALPYRTRYHRPELVSPAGESPEPIDEKTSPDPEPEPAGEPSVPLPPLPAATMSVGGEPQSIEPDPDPADAPDPEEQRLHEEARRFAALLASEIVLYNEKQLEEGRRNKDLYERLKDDIDRSYRMFEQRVSSKISGASRYFKEEIVRALAKGDESAIRLPWD